MHKEAYYSILSKIEVIEKTDKLLKDLKAVKEEPLNVFSYNTYEKRKWHLTEELLKEMMKARLSYRQFENLYKKIFNYLYVGKYETILPKDLQRNVNKAEELWPSN